MISNCLRKKRIYNWNQGGKSYSGIPNHSLPFASLLKRLCMRKSSKRLIGHNMIFSNTPFFLFHSILREKLGWRNFFYSFIPYLHGVIGISIEPPFKIGEKKQISVFFILWSQTTSYNAGEHLIRKSVKNCIEWYISSF